MAKTASFSFRQITAPVEKTNICTSITQTIPEWFGIENANQMYAAKIANKDVFAAFADDEPVGAIVLHYHFETTAEVWWMGVRAQDHRKGVGRELMNIALVHAIEQTCDAVVLNTLSPKSSDQGYAKTRKFYEASGFRPLVNFDEDDPFNPMMWMIKTLGN